MSGHPEHWDAPTYERERLIWAAVLEGLQNPASTEILDQALAFTRQADQPETEWQLLLGVTAALFGKTLAKLIGEDRAVEYLTTLLRTNEIDAIILGLDDFDLNELDR